MEFFKNFNIPTSYLIGIGVFMTVYILGMILYMKKRKAQAKDWEAQNPTGSKIYVHSKTILVKTDGIYIHSVDGGKPNSFIEGAKTGFYVLPGSHVIEATFTTSRPGVVHKTVTTSYGPAKVEVEVEARKSYYFSFNEDEKRFEFSEQ